MSIKINKRPQALKDLLEQAQYIAQDNLDAAERFLDAAEAAFKLLSEMPGMGTMCHFRSPRAAGIRRWPVRGFERHLIFYLPTTEGIEVVRVIHAARDIESIFSDEPEE